MATFRGKVVIVTGASSGIGEATALAFAKQGAKLTLVGRNTERLEKVTEECRNYEGCEVLELVLDLGKFDNLKPIVDKTVQKFGGIDILVNNAALGQNPKLPEIESYQGIMDVNLRAPVFLCKFSLPHLKKTKGRVINVSSTAAIKCNPERLSYCMSKVALDHFTRGFAAECAPCGVRVNSINPGVVNTRIFTSTDRDISDYAKLQPMGILGPEEIADSILFICLSDHMTGSCVLHDGGFCLEKST